MTAISIFNDAAEAQHLLKIIDKREHGIVWEDDTLNPDYLALLIISSCRLTSISPLYNVGLHRLTSLNLSFNRIADISHLAHLGALRSLDISHNRIVSIDALRKMSLLTTLRCHNNAIESLEPLMSAPLLNELWLADNKIEWLEYIFLMPLINLNHLVKFNNPADAKPKLDQFLWSCCSSLQTLDGADYLAYSSAAAGAAFESAPLDFLKTVDGKVMLTQAKSHLAPAVRAQLQPFVERINIYADNEYAQQQQGGLYHERTGHLRNRQAKSGQHPNASTSPSRYTQDDEGVVRRSDKAGDSNMRLGFYRSRPARVRIYKAKKSSNSRVQQALPSPRRIAGEAAAEGLHGNSSDYSMAFPQQKQNPPLSPRLGTEPPPPALSSFSASSSASSSSPRRAAAASPRAVDPRLGLGLNPNPNRADDPASSPIQHHHQQQSQASPYRPAADEPNTGYARGTSIVRFSDTDEAGALCLCLQENGSGYARWKKGGPVACSFENGRIFSSYRGGAIAVVLDRDGSGSIMNPRGKCVCLVNTNGSAKIMDKSGNVLSELRQHAGSEAASADEGYTWKFDGLHIAFRPVTWEIIVKFANDRVVCEFSSLHGGKLLKNKGEEKFERDKERARQRQRDNEAGAPGGVAEAPAPDHAGLRSGLASITSGLDLMLDGLKARGGPLLGADVGRAGAGLAKKGAPQRASKYPTSSALPIFRR